MQDLGNGHFLIICCTYAQAKAFRHVRHVQMDLAFKLVRGKTNVFSVNSWDEQARRKDILSICATCAELMLSLCSRNQYLLLCLDQYRYKGCICYNV